MADLIAFENGFGPRLRHERERRKISLATIAASTKIGIPLLQGLERDDFSRWPSGIFRRSFVRAYAQAIGLDADAVLREFVERFPDPEETPPEAEEPRPDPTLPAAAPDSFVRVRIVEAVRGFRGGAILTGRRQRWAAAAWDAGIVVAIALLLFAVINSFWKPFGVLAMTYYVGGILVLGNTPGVCLFAGGPDEDGRGVWPRGVDLGALVRRIRTAIDPRIRS